MELLSESLTTCIGGELKTQLKKAVGFYKIPFTQTGYYLNHGGTIYTPDGVPSLYTNNGAFIHRDSHNAIIQNIEAINAVAGGSLAGKTIEIEFDELPMGSQQGIMDF